MDILFINEIIGWVGAIGYTLCGLPLAYNIWKYNDASGLNWAFVSLWGTGEICTLTYVMLGNYLIGNWQIPLLVNYILNFFVLWYIVYMKYTIEKK